MSHYGYTLTRKGRALLARILAEKMPLTLTRETAREYTLSAAPLDQFAVQDMLERRLREMLEAELGEGEILDAKYTALLRDGALRYIAALD